MWKKVEVKSQLGFEIGAKTQYSKGQTCHLLTFLTPLPAVHGVGVN